MSFYQSKDIVPYILEDLERKYDEYGSLRRKDEKRRVFTGIGALDDITGGFKSDDLILVGGMEGVGKSAFCHRISSYLTMEKDLPVAVYSPRIDKELIFLRIMASVTGVTLRKLQNGGFEGSHWQNILEVIEKLHEAPLFIDDAKELSPEIIEDGIGELADLGARLIIFDSLDMAKNKKGRGDQLCFLKGLADKYQVPVLMTQTLSPVISSGPSLSDLKASGIDDQDADIVLFIRRDMKRDIYRMEEQPAEVLVAKCREDYPGKSFYMSFIPALLKFS